MGVPQFPMAMSRTRCMKFSKNGSLIDDPNCNVVSVSDCGETEHGFVTGCPNSAYLWRCERENTRYFLTQCYEQIGMKENCLWHVISRDQQCSICCSSAKKCTGIDRCSDWKI